MIEIDNMVAQFNDLTPRGQTDFLRKLFKHSIADFKIENFEDGPIGDIEDVKHYETEIYLTTKIYNK